MLLEEPGPVAERLLLLGSRQVTSYLVLGDAYAWIGGGTAWGAARVEDQLDRFEVDRTRVRYLVVSHAHHDHCGAVPYLLRRYPWLEVVASHYAAEVLAKEKPVRLMQDLNTRTLDRLGRDHTLRDTPLEFAPISVRRPVGDGDELALGGGLTLRFYATPGHSRCSLSVYVPELRTLFPGDSIPYPEKGRPELTVTANHDYGDYLASLRKLEGLALDFVAYEHGGVLAGDGARTVVARGLEAALKQRERLRKRFDELGDQGALVDEIVAKYGALELFEQVPGDALRAIIRKMVQSALAPT